MVSLTPLATRGLVALGAGDRLATVDSESPALAAPDASTPALDPQTLSEADLVLLGAEPDAATAAVLAAAGCDWTVVAPHDIEDLLAVWRALGPRLVGEARTSALEVAWTEPLAEIAGEMAGRPRADVLAIVGFEPVTLAGGHSFETDLIEIAGARSLTHGGEEPRLVLADDAPPSGLAPELILVATDAAPTAEQRLALASRWPGARAIEHWPLRDARGDPIWLEDPVVEARRLRRRIASLVAERDAPSTRRNDAE